MKNGNSDFKSLKIFFSMDLGIWPKQLNLTVIKKPQKYFESHI